jgi:chitin synthase
MRFVVFIDLFSTIVQPVGVLYIAYLIYTLATTSDPFPVISVVLLAAIYGFQVIIFILKRQWAQIGWMIVYLISVTFTINYLDAGFFVLSSHIFFLAF